jgi:5-methylcytosine-specific restriction endonuclease McrA
MAKRILATQRSRMYRLFKESLKCCSCGYDRDSSALEFHHIIPVDKLEEIPKLVSIGDYDIIISEFKKCAVICSNCHNIIHNSTNAKVALEVVKALIPVNTTYFKELCEAFNVLVDDTVEDENDQESSSENIELLVAEEKLNKKKRMEILIDHLIEKYDGIATDNLKAAKIARDLSFNRITVSRYIEQLKTEQKLNGVVHADLLRAI